MLRGMADVEANPGFNGYNSPESACPKGMGFSTQSRIYFVNNIEIIHRKREKLIFSYAYAPADALITDIAPFILTPVFSRRQQEQNH